MLGYAPVGFVLFPSKRLGLGLGLGLVRVRVRVRLGVLGPTIEAKSDCGCARSLNSFWPPILRSQRPKKMFLC